MAVAPGAFGVLEVYKTVDLLTPRDTGLLPYRGLRSLQNCRPAYRGNSTGPAVGDVLEVYKTVDLLTEKKSEESESEVLEVYKTVDLLTNWFCS